MALHTDPKKWGLYDAKALTSIEYHCDRIRADVFDESDVALLLVLLRNWVGPKSILGEFAGFTAHRVRDRGHFKRHLVAIWEAVQNHGPRAAAKYDLRSFEPLFSSQQIGNELNTVLSQLSIEPVEEARFPDIMLCVMSLLQDAVVKDDDKPFGTLSMFHDQSSAYCVAVLQLRNSRLGIPILKVDRIIDWPKAPPDDNPNFLGREAKVTFSFRRVNGFLESVERELPPKLPNIGLK